MSEEILTTKPPEPQSITSLYVFSEQINRLHCEMQQLKRALRRAVDAANTSGLAIPVEDIAAESGVSVEQLNAWIDDG
jgi:hypothetical protein